MSVKGQSLDSEIEYKKVNGTHLVTFLSGKLKGTMLTTTLSKTWSFDGLPDAGTLVIMKLDLKLQSFLLDLFVTDSMVLYGLDVGLEKLENQAEKLQNSAKRSEKQSQNTKSTRQTSKPQSSPTAKTQETESIIPTKTPQLQPKQQTEIPDTRGPTIQQKNVELAASSIKPTPKFVDPEKDPWSYVDRYKNEQVYREWFDRNYPEYTIYEAVGLPESA